MPAKCKEREKILASSIVGVPSLPVAAVRGHLCFRCFSSAESLSKCAGCQRAFYCSQDCQKLDWAKSHKRQCKTLRKINEIDLEVYQERRTWHEYSRALMRLVRKAQSLSDNRDVTSIIQAQPYCIGCRRSANQLRDRNLSLTACQKCRLIFTCDSCQATHAPSVCEAYLNYFNIEIFKISLFEDVGDITVVAGTTKPRATYEPLTAASSWHDYFVNVSDKAMIKERIKPDFSGLTESAFASSADQLTFEQNRHMFLLMAIDNLTMPLTIVSAIEDLAWSSRTKINIHLLGATGREFLAIKAFEEILHLLPSLRDLQMTAIGPSSWLDQGQMTGYQVMEMIDCCPACKAKGRSRPFASFRGLYHEFLTTAQYAQPDLIVAFNSGWIDGDDAETDWQPTIRHIVDSGTPALFTTYDGDEAEHEKSVLDRLGTKFIVEPEVNKWKGLVPTPEFVDMEFRMWHQNMWRYVIQGRR